MDYIDTEIDYSYEVWYGLGYVEELEPEEGDYEDIGTRDSRGTKVSKRNFGGTQGKHISLKWKGYTPRREGSNSTRRDRKTRR